MSMNKTSGSSNQTLTVTPTEMETKLNQQTYDMNQFMQPFMKQNYASLSENIQAILTGQTPMAKGIGGISESDTQQMVNDSLRSVMPQFQMNGLMDSGVAAQAGVRAAADVRNANAQFNTSAAQNLFNLASGGQSNLQSQGNQLTSILGSQLAGLRGQSSSGKTSSSSWGLETKDLASLISAINR